MQMLEALILYGPPASGKDTISQLVSRLDPRYVLFRKIKSGAGSTGTYRVISEGRLATMRAAGRVQQESRRYGNTYVVDKDQLDYFASAGRRPMLHMGDLPGVVQLKSYGRPARWQTVLLWAPPDVTHARLAGRRDTNVRARMEVWIQTVEELLSSPEALFDFIVNTGDVSALDAAQAILKGDVGSPVATIESGVLRDALTAASAYIPR
ncbi:MAG: hypothetical protein ACRDRH_19120 [Pseudonocardia sp.]